MEQLGRIFFYIAGFFLVLGLLTTFGGRVGLGRLPGDILVKKENFVFYFPLATGILISIILSLIAGLLRRL